MIPLAISRRSIHCARSGHKWKSCCRQLSISDTLRRTGNTGALVVRPFSPSVFYEVGLLKPNLGELSVVATQFVKLLDDYTAPHLARS